MSGYQITKDGRKVELKRFMELPPNKPGYCWSNVSKLGEKPIWKEVVDQHIPDTGKLFGYDQDVFLAKQYK